MTIINEQSVLKQRYIRHGLTPAAAYDKAIAVMELRDELAEVPGYDHLSAGELLAAAEHEYQAGEEAMREMVERTNRPVPLTVERQADELYLERGQHWLLLSAHEWAAVLGQIKRQMAAARKAQKRATIHGRRQAEGRAPFRVVGGRLANEQAA